MGRGVACPELGRLAGPGGGQTLRVKLGQMQLWGGVGRCDILTPQPVWPWSVSLAMSAWLSQGGRDEPHLLSPSAKVVMLISKRSNVAQSKTSYGSDPAI